MASPIASRRSRLQLLSPAPLSPMGRKAITTGDRFIPSRSAMDLDLSKYNLLHDTKENSHSTSEVASPVKEEYRRMLAENFLCDSSGVQSPKVLVFKKKPPVTGVSIERSLSELVISPSRKFYRQIPQTPERILDAPELVNDYYLNLLDWSCSNVVAVALGAAVYLWDADTCQSGPLVKFEESELVTSLAWSDDGNYLAIGLNSAYIQMWDVRHHRQLRTFRGHSARVSSLAWNGSMLSSGGRDHKIINHDVRSKTHRASVFLGHSQEVCGLKWSPSGQQLASGGNDNLLYIWDVSVASSFESNPSDSKHFLRTDSHHGAVKALAWCPFQSHLLASGGGTNDRCIKFWNTQSGICVNSIETSSQVCALQWNRHQKEILSSHGYSLNQLCLWKYPSMVKIAELKGHTDRVIHMAQSPDGYTVASAAPDETLRFWKVFGTPNKRVGIQTCGLSRAASIR